MAIPRLKPDVPLNNNVTSPSTIEAPKNSIFTALVPETKVNSLLKYVEGYPWTVNYYGQLINTNNNLENFDPSTPNLTQPYYKVSHLILQVSSPLSSSYDQATGITSISGSGVAPYKLTPNVGDVFIAQVDTGEDAVFHITSVTRKTHRKDTLYEISYTLLNYTNLATDLIGKLEARVQDEYFFNPDTNFFNRDILIAPPVKVAIDQLKSFLVSSKQYYFDMFAKRQTGSILIPGVLDKVYDPELLGFISKIVEYDIIADYPFFRFTSLSDQETQFSILTALSKRSPGLLRSVVKQYAFLPAGLLLNKARLGTAQHAGIDYVLEALTPQVKTLVGEKVQVYERSVFLDTIKTDRNYELNDELVGSGTNNAQLFQKPLLHELFEDDTYIVSPSFYAYLTDNSQFDKISYVELLIARFIRNEAIVKEDLAMVVQTYDRWSLLHQLYLLPVLWLIAQSQL